MTTYDLEPELVPEGFPLKIDSDLLLNLISPAYFQGVIDDAYANGIIEIIDGDYRLV